MAVINVQLGYNSLFECTNKIFKLSQLYYWLNHFFSFHRFSALSRPTFFEKEENFFHFLIHGTPLFLSRSFQLRFGSFEWRVARSRNSSEGIFVFLESSFSIEEALTFEYPGVLLFIFFFCGSSGTLSWETLSLDLWVLERGDCLKL